MGKKVDPVRPEDVSKGNVKNFPPGVIEAFNELIRENFLGSGSATFKQDEVVARIKKKGIDEKEAFKKGWLDVEDLYRLAGWAVEYDKPAFNETYDATFTFRVKKKGS